MSRLDRSCTDFFASWREQNAATEVAASTNVAADGSTAHRLPHLPYRVRRGARAVLVLATAVAATVTLLPRQAATADPSAHTWHRLRMCESSNNYATDTGNGYYGAYQFDLPTWRSVGGSGSPSQASKAEQDARALMLYRQRGWQPWTCASILGLREDSDAGSGRTDNIDVAGSRNRPAATPDHRSAPRTHATHVPPAATISSDVTLRVPAFPGTRWYAYGDDNRNIKTFQDQMHRRGYFPVGTGEYGPNTLRMVKQLQRLNSLVPNGYLGPNTWRLAWVGRYRSP